MHTTPFIPMHNILLQKKIKNTLNLEEYYLLCFRLGVDWDELKGETISNKTSSLISHLKARGQLVELLALLREYRPEVDWPELPPVTQRTVSGQAPPLKGISVPDTRLQDILHLHYPEVWTEIVQRGLYKKTLSLSDLVRKIRDYFDENELRDICLTLDVNYDGQLGGYQYYYKARELVLFCQRTGKLNDLIKLCKEQRPHIIWDYD